MPRIAYVNGRYVPHKKATVHIEDRGFQFADGVYEAFALIGGYIADETGHVERLERSLKELGIAMPMSRRALGLVMRELVRRNKLADAMIYLQVTRGAATRDFSVPEGLRPSLIMTMRSVSYDLDVRKKIARKAITVPDIRWKRCDIKTPMLIPPILAKQAAKKRGAQEAWFVDDKGFVTEASSSNAWIVDKNGHLVTAPARGNHILKGVTRTVMQALCKKEKIKIVERPFTPAEAYKAREAFTSAAFSLFTPIVEIDGHKIGNGKPGPVVAKLYDLYMEYVRRGKQEHWRAE